MQSYPHSHTHPRDNHAGPHTDSTLAELRVHRHAKRAAERSTRQRRNALVAGVLAVAIALVAFSGVAAFGHGASESASTSASLASASTAKVAVKAKKTKKKHTRASSAKRVASKSGAGSKVASTASAERAKSSSVAVAAVAVVRAVAVAAPARTAKTTSAAKTPTRTTKRKTTAITIETFGYDFGGPPKGTRFLADVRNIDAGDFSQSETGLMASVRARVMAVPAAQRWLATMETKWTPSLKNGDLIAIGCARGHHRSVTLAVLYGQYLKSKGYSVTFVHRDIKKTW